MFTISFSRLLAHGEGRHPVRIALNQGEHEQLCPLLVGVVLFALRYWVHRFKVMGFLLRFRLWCA